MSLWDPGTLGLALLAMATTSDASAQTVPVIGYVAAKNANPKRLEVFRQGLVELGYDEEEMRRIGDSFDLPLVANMVERGRTPLLTRPQLEALGFRLAIFPTVGFLAATAAMERAYSAIRDTGSSLPVIDQLYDFGGFNKLIGFEEVWAFDRAHAD
jgi:hypothetical protein